MQVKDITYYKRAFVNLRRQPYGVEKAPHKVILLLAVIDRVEQLVNMGTAGRRMIDKNLIDLNPKLERFFYRNWNRNVTSDKFHAVFHVPFYHMKNEPFWRLVRKENGMTEDGNMTDNVLKANYVGAEIDHNLMNLLVDAQTREVLRDFLLDLLCDSKREQDLIIPEKAITDYLPPCNEFWEEFIQLEKKCNGKFANALPSNKTYLEHTINKTNIKLVIAASFSYVEFYYRGKDSHTLYTQLLKDRREIETSIGPLEWINYNEHDEISIKKKTKYSYVNPLQWISLFNFFSLTILEFYNTFDKYFVQEKRNVNTPVQTALNKNLEGFIKFMRGQKLSENTINKYAYQAANNAELLQIIYSSTGQISLYDITEYLKLVPILDFVRRCNFDQVGHHMYSAAISKYIQFLKTPVIHEEQTIQLTRELIEAARTPNGGFTKSQLAAIDVTWPPAPDWIEQKEGLMITKSQLEQFNKIQYVATNKVSRKKR